MPLPHSPPAVLVLKPASAQPVFVLQVNEPIAAVFPRAVRCPLPKENAPVTS